MMFIAIWEQSWENVPNFNAKRKAWYDSMKPETFKVIGAYSLQGPTSKGVTLFETDRIEDINLYRNYFALAGASIDIRPAIDYTASVEVTESLLARW
jgi:hypothetical protein